MRRIVLSAVFVLRLAAAVDRGRLLRAVGLMTVGYLATPVIALGLREFTEAALARRLEVATWVIGGVAVLLVLELMLGHFAHLSYFEVGELAETTLNEELVRHVNGSRGLERLDDPAFADNVNLVREELGNTRTAVESVLQLGGLALQTALTTVVLVTLDPRLALLPLAALPSVLVGRWAQNLLESAKEASAENTRRTRHLLALATAPASIKEIRLFHAEAALLREQDANWSRTSAVLRRAHLRAATLRAAGQLVFALAYGGAITLVLWQAEQGRAGVGDVILVITLAVQVSVQVAGAATLLTGLQGVGRTLDRLTSLRDHGSREQGSREHEAGERGSRKRGHATPSRTSPVPGAVPAVLREGIRLENLSFVYPGTGKVILEDLNLTIPAGGSVALVGENGAGKSTLVKLLCGLYQPTSGRILVDGTDLRDLPAGEWQARVASLFQDFARFELLLRENVGVGDVARMEDEQAVLRAVELARAGRIVASVPGGLSGLLGHGYGQGTELSMGQWQTLGLARSQMREDPLLLVLDEPAAALDAAAEHAIFERYANLSADTGRRSGGITLFVSHRFSTVRMADMIVVLDRGRVAESGDHRALVTRRGLYAELYELQERIYH
ncbi:ABC transporter ATP-binding protein [Microbispora triticiradicis]|uniref:ABC transporter ATP-binding protein n=1 Tax=Microbispora triticiradicis TaxID=2200763 RepID=A0ABX9L9X3_9ACTN|nr:ABC transporter ATP-binding protein [Microbispora triticiradicis]RGA00773.1 ABC transporter ATP-binding protein [Microbispora triticiradicis]